MPEERRIELEVIDGPMDGRVFAVTAEKFCVGRDPENDISLPGDRKLKKLSHMEVTANGAGEWILVKSGKGTVHVDGRRVSSDIKLTPGQRVKVGKTTLLVNRTTPRKPGEVDDDPLKPREGGTIPVHRI